MAHRIDDDIIYKGTLLDSLLGGGGGSAIAYGVAAGTNTYTVTISGITSYLTGQPIYVKFTNGNTGASTINVNDLGAISIRKAADSTLLINNILAGCTMIMVYDGTNFIIVGKCSTLRGLPVSFTQVTSGTAFTITIAPNDRIQRAITGANLTNTSYLEFTIPPDFVAFPSNAFSIDTRRNTANANTVVTFGKEGVADAGINGISLTATATNNTWETKQATPTGTYAPGDRV